MKTGKQKLLAFMLERHRIYLRRQEGAKFPWTDDAILQTYSFTNVYRELDKVTVWVRKNIREPYADHPYLWFMLCVARYLNWPPTLQEIMGTEAWPSTADWNAKRLTRVLAERKIRGDKVYTGAYMIRAESNALVDWYKWSKQRYIAEIVLGRVWDAKDGGEGQEAIIKLSLGNDDSTIQGTTQWLSSQYGWGGFMAYEVASDLRHTRYLRNAPDIMTWANPGPGARRGLNRVAGRDFRQALPEGQAVEEMREILWWLRHHGWPIAPGWINLEMREVEHSLCEFDKYERVRLGQGRPRALYTPAG